MVADLSALRSVTSAGAEAPLDMRSTLLAHGGTMAVGCPQPPVAEMLAAPARMSACPSMTA